jgi:perosamine synthetase
MTTGEGGMVVTPSEELAHRVRLLRSQGMARRYENEIVGLNNRMSDLHAAIGRAQLRKLPAFNAARQRNAAFLSANLHGVATPPVAPNVEHVFHQYTIRVPIGRDAFAEALAQRGVATGVYYPVPIHRLPSFDEDLELPVTNQAAAEVLSLPVHPSLTQGDLEHIVTAVNAVAQEGS